MKNKGFFKTAAALLAALVLLGGFSVTAYAGGGEDIPTNDSGVIVETEPQPLTPDGNLSLIDDIEGEAAEDKQFIIVQSKNGNYFYIIVDRAAEGENTVHFLNQVDEADLMALMEGDSSKAQAPAVCTCKDKCKAGAVNTVCPVCSVNMTECAGNFQPPRRSAGGRKYGSGYPLPMLAILLFAFFHAKNEEMPKPNAEKKKHRNLRRSQWLYARKNGGFYSPAVSFLTSCIAFAVAVITVKSLLSMLSSNVSSCRRCVDLSVSLFGKKNWSTETSKSVTSS